MQKYREEYKYVSTLAFVGIGLLFASSYFEWEWPLILAYIVLFFSSVASIIMLVKIIRFRKVLKGEQGEFKIKLQTPWFTYLQPLGMILVIWGNGFNFGASDDNSPYFMILLAGTFGVPFIIGQYLLGQHNFIFMNQEGIEISNEDHELEAPWKQLEKFLLLEKDIEIKVKGSDSISISRDHISGANQAKLAKALQFYESELSYPPDLDILTQEF